MREIVETGTDIAALGVGDPTLLGPLRECRGQRYAKIRDQLVTEGCLWRLETDADGSYLFHVLVGEDPPAELAPYLFEPIEVERFRVPSGRLLIAGEELFIGALDAADYPHMGREIAVPPGDYRMTASRSEPPDEILDERFQAAASPNERAAWRWGNRLPGLGVLFSIAGLVAAYIAYTRWLSVLFALLSLAMVVAAWVGISRYRKGDRFQAARNKFRALELELPSIVIVLRATGG